MKYSQKLKDPRWQRKRLEIFNRDNFTCQRCGNSNDMLAVHHISYNKNPWESTNENLITLCSACHEEIHFVIGNKNMFWEYINLPIAQVKKEIVQQDIEFIDEWETNHSIEWVCIEMKNKNNIYKNRIIYAKAMKGLIKEFYYFS